MTQTEIYVLTVMEIGSPRPSAEGLISRGASLFGLQMATLLPRSHMAFSVCVHGYLVSSYEDTSDIGLGP